MLILGGSVVTRIRLESSLPVDVVNKYDRNDRENKHNQSRFKCLIVTPVKTGSSWRQGKENKVSIFWRGLSLMELIFGMGRSNIYPTNQPPFPLIFPSNTTQTPSAFLNCN